MRIALGSYMVRYPLGGMMSWVLQYLRGFDALGHDVYFVESSGYPGSCYDPELGVMGDDCSTGTRIVNELLKAHGLGERWCFVDIDGEHHGLSKAKLDDVLASADLFVDMGTHGAFLERIGPRVRSLLLDGEPGFTQMKLETERRHEQSVKHYDSWFTTGRSIASGDSHAPTAGLAWHPVFHPVMASDFEFCETAPDSSYGTVMNWKSYGRYEFDGIEYGHKDLEFDRFIELPKRVDAALEIAVSGSDVPKNRLREQGWRIASAKDATRTYDSFRDYIKATRGEFSVCKNGFVALETGWFSDRSAAFLASGRPVVLQETGFSRHLPTGEGLFAVRNVDEAAAAIDAIESDPGRHMRAAREIACEHLDAPKVLRSFLDAAMSDAGPSRTCDSDAQAGLATQEIAAVARDAELRRGNA